MAKIGHLGVDQHGGKYILGEHPRKELMERLGTSHVEKMYRDPDARHVGYILGGLWVTVYEVHSWPN